MCFKLLSRLFQAKIGSITRLSGGSTEAQNFIFDVIEETWLLRIFSPQHTIEENLNEGLISQVVGEQDLSGRVIHYDQQCLVREYVKGNILSYANLSDPHIIKKVITLLKIQHQIPTEKLPIAPTCQARIQQHLTAINLPNLFSDLDINIMFSKSPCPNVLIHNDLHHANILLQDGQVQFIDWSLSGVGDLFYDLAEMAIYVEAELRHLILELYFGNTQHNDHLHHACQERLLLFAVWALNKTKQTSIDIERLKTAKQDFSTWLKRITSGEQSLNSVDSYLDFSASCFAEFKRNN